MKNMYVVLAAALLALGSPAFADDGKDESNKGHSEWMKDREKAEKERDKAYKDAHKAERKAAKEARKHAAQREKDWRKQDERWHKETAKRWEHERRHGDKHAYRGDYFRQHGYARVDIPHGHLPPPGECRVWYPNRPAGHQPAPGRCARLAAQVPAGGWLIERPDGSQRYYVSAYEPSRAGVLLDRSAFDWRGGVLVLVAQLP